MAYTISTAGSELEFATTDFLWPGLQQLDDNHFLAFGHISGSATSLLVLAVNTSTWAVSTLATPLTIVAGAGTRRTIWTSQVDVNHFVTLFESGTTLMAQIISINTTTWSVTTAAGALSFSTAVQASGLWLEKIDDTHHMAIWNDAALDGFAQIIEVNTSTWVISTAAAEKEYQPTRANGPLAVKVDANHVFVNYLANDAQILEVNTTSWAITTVAAELSGIAPQFLYHSFPILIDANHVLGVYRGGDSTANDDVYGTIFAINTTSWAVTTVSVLKYRDDVTNSFTTNVVAINSTRYLASCQDGTSVYAQVLGTDSLSVSTDSSEFTIGASGGTGGGGGAFYQIDSSHYLCVRCGTDSDGFAVVLEVLGPPAGPNAMPGFMF